jgi:tRNA pseudouridine38-40 synthase
VRNVKVVVEYDGTDYFGFQYQPGVPTIQGELERVVAKIVKERVTIYGSGRTDSGVHAAGQVINFRTNCTIPIDRVCIAMNTLLPRGIAAVEACDAESDFHARYSAKSRFYRYVILNRELRSALTGRYCWQVGRPLDVDPMSEGARFLLGSHDFSAFECAGSDIKTKVRDMTFVHVKRSGEQVIIELRASAFLRSMVRNIVGTLVEVGFGKRPAAQVEEILCSRDRCVAGITAPPQGLCLVEVEY